MTYVTKHIDWLAVTLPASESYQMVVPLGRFTYMGSGNHGYQARYLERYTGTEIQTDSQDTQMGHHLIFSGSALEANLRVFACTQDNLLDKLVRAHGKATRIDLAINIHEGSLTPETLRRHIESGKAKAKARSWRMVEGKNGDVAGSTLYIGSPHSDVQLRCYDKAAEQGIVNGDAWIRLELELRRLRAKSAMLSCHSNGIAETVTGHVSDFLSCEHPDLELAYSGSASVPMPLEPRQSNRARWLLGQVVQALAKEATINPQFLEAFNRALAAELARLTIEARNSKLG